MVTQPFLLGIFGYLLLAKCILLKLPTPKMTFNIDETYLLALYVNAPDALAHFTSLVSHTTTEKTKKIPPLRSE